MYNKALQSLRKDFERNQQAPSAPSGLMGGKRPSRVMKTEDPNQLLNQIYSSLRGRSKEALARSEYNRENASSYVPAETSKRTTPTEAPKETGEVEPTIGADIDLDNAPTGASNYTESGDSGDYLDKMISVESGGNSNAKNPNSSALGSAQFIDSTWFNLVKDLGERGEAPWAENLSRDEILNLRRNPKIEKQVLKEFRERNRSYLTKNKIPVNNETEYAAHFLGNSDAVKLFKSPDSTPVKEVIKAASIKANPTILGGDKTVGDIKNWLRRKMS